MAESIETNRLLLRPWSEDDRHPFAELASDARVMRYIGDGSTWDAARAALLFDRQLRHWEEHGFGWRSATLAASGEWVGFLALNHVAPEVVEATGDEVEIGWWLHPDHWGGGLATEGAFALRDEGFERVGLERIIGRHRPANLASGRIMRRIGMTFERDALDRHGDVVRIQAVTRDEWLASTGTTSPPAP